MMRDMGFREETVKRLCEELPPAVLKDSTGFRKKLDLLKSFRFSSREIDQILFSYPKYLRLSFEARLKPLVDELHEMNFSNAEIRAAILENPKPSLRLEPGELSRYIVFLDSLRCRHLIKERILSRGYLQAAIDVKLRIECLHKHGLILRDAFKVLHVEPRAILYDLEDIEEKIKFLSNRMQFRIEHLVECPEYLGVNLHKQIVPRYNVFEHLRSLGGLGDEVWMKHYVKLSRMEFYNMFVKPYPECENIFNGFTREKRVKPRHPAGMWKLFKPQKFEQSEKDVRNMRDFMRSLGSR
jgi:mTERF